VPWPKGGDGNSSEGNLASRSSLGLVLFLVVFIFVLAWVVFKQKPHDRFGNRGVFEILCCVALESSLHVAGAINPVLPNGQMSLRAEIALAHV